MKRAGVEPTERIPHQTFWADAKKRVHLATLPEEATRAAIPCECVFRKRGRVVAELPPCDCLAPPGTGHALWCARVFGDDQREAA